MKIDIDTLFARVPSAYVLLDPELRIVWVNDAYLKTVGRARETLIGRFLLEEFPADEDTVSDQMLRASFNRVLTTAQTDHLPLIPYPIRDQDGNLEDRFWSATHTPLLDSGGAIEYILQNTMDVTDLYQSDLPVGADRLPKHAALLQRAEAVASENLELEAMSAFFKSAFDQAPSFMAIVDGPSHIFKIINQAYYDLVGDRDLIGRAVREGLPDLEGQGFFELLDQVYETGEPISITGMRATLKAPADGSPAQRYIDFIYHPLKDDSGKCTGIFVQGHDVTGQKLAEDELNVTREKFRTMAQTMPNHVWTAQPDGKLDWLSDQLYDFTGMQEGDLYGDAWGRAVHPDDLSEAAASWTDAIANARTYATEFRLRKADGSYHWHLVRATPLRSADGVLIGWVGTNTDIQERKTAEDQIAELNETLERRVEARNRELEDVHNTLRQSQKMEAIGSLAGGIAHDFNNLLQVITGNLQMAMRTIEAGSPAQSRIALAMKSVGRGAKLSSQLLSFARKQPLEPIVVDLTSVIGQMVGILQSAVGEGVELKTQFAPDLWNCSVDVNSLENAILNLSINARDAMDRLGTLSIEVENTDLSQSRSRTYRSVPPGKYVVIKITDTGSGMAPDVIDRIFEPFFTTKLDGNGTGLGLSMVYGFAKQSGGHITIESEVGTGTTIAMFLPRSLKEPASSRIISVGGMPRGTEDILLVEDDDDVRDTAYELLTDLGYHVLVAENGDAALKLLEGGANVDLLFTDVIMPGGINGHQLSEKARLLRPDLPVLFSSGYVQDAIVHEGRLDEGVHLLSKPYTQSAMAQKIRGILCRETILSDGESRADAFVPAQTPPDPMRDTAPRSDHAVRKVVICEDDVLIRTDIAFGLKDDGWDVLQCGSITEAITLLHSETPDLLLTDLGLPDGSGLDLAKQARLMRPGLPIIFATGGPEISGEDRLINSVTLSKPFLSEDLSAAVKEVMGA
ncbi:PAS domain-containing protein [Albirhodobacter sp. R86504]|uniref:PAS domain-containing protein n=1 Tax=Albirhodobacter sp. R86504 TaxID=3093848 RepID=UPI00366D02C2